MCLSIRSRPMCFSRKQLCHHAPFYVLGPLVTDIAAGHDHVACAIGGAIAGEAGADFLCYVTPAEHLCLPSVEDVREGVIVTKIAAHAADIARENKQAMERDRQMSMASKNLDWEAQMRYAIDPKKACKMREDNPPAEGDVCTMCGSSVPLRRSESTSGNDPWLPLQSIAEDHGREPAGICSNLVRRLNPRAGTCLGLPLSSIQLGAADQRFSFTYSTAFRKILMPSPSTSSNGFPCRNRELFPGRPVRTVGQMMERFGVGHEAEDAAGGVADAGDVA